MQWLSWVLFLLILSGPFSVEAHERYPEGDPRGLLRGRLSLTAAEVRDIGQGKVVIKILNGGRKQELALLGIARINVPPDFFAARYGKDGMCIETASARRKGQFSHRPVLDDLSGLSLPLDELKELSRCRSTDCKVKADGTLMEKFRPLDPSAPGFRERGNRIIREAMVAYVRKYLTRGDGALIEYCDKRTLIRAKDEMEDMIRCSSLLRDLAPELQTHLKEFPRRGSRDIEDLLYWTFESFDRRSLRPVFSIHHLARFSPPNPSRGMIVASKQIYATHYFEVALGLTFILKDSRKKETGGLYLIHLNRSRIDILRELPSFLAKRLFERVQGLLDRKMVALKKSLEEDFKITTRMAGIHYPAFQPGPGETCPPFIMPPN
ncbi:MAG: hypothetical protein JRF57_10180 [Deltaproteobacteria bacterium]|nr:hypothetical protein [Deltaproteobacteria bacterium]MBW2304068.1 hypothetical protein [Deltaproteobacteria bacterium]